MISPRPPRVRAVLDDEEHGRLAQQRLRQVDRLTPGPQDCDSAFDQRQCVVGPAARRERDPERQRCLAVHLLDAALVHEFHGLSGQQPLFFETPLLARDERTVGQRRPGHDPLPPRGRQPRRLGEPPSASPNSPWKYRLKPIAQQATGRQRDPRIGLKLDRAAGIYQLGADISPGEDGRQQRQGRLDQAETGPPQPRAMIAQPFNRRDCQCCLPPLADSDNTMLGPGAAARRRPDSVRQVAGARPRWWRTCTKSATKPAGLRSARRGLGAAFVTHGVLDRLLGRPVIAMPGICARWCSAGTRPGSRRSSSTCSSCAKR